MKKRLALKIIAIVLLVLIISITILVSRLSGSSTGTILDTSTVNISTQPQFNFSPKTITGKYIIFSYPVSLIQTVGDQVAGSTLESYSFYYRDIESWKLTIIVNQLHSSSLGDDSSYEFRNLNPGLYKKTETTFNNHMFVIMTDTSMVGFSEVAFSLNGLTSADISLYGDDTLGTKNLQSTFNMVLSSWRWRAV